MHELSRLLMRKAKEASHHHDREDQGMDQPWRICLSSAGTRSCHCVFSSASLLCLVQHSSIPDDEFDNIRMLVYTYSAIKQANTDIRSKRPELKAMVDELLNNKRKADGLAEMDDNAFWKRIERANANLQKMTATDRRDQRRMQWLSYDMQKMHYENFEDFVVKNEFGQPSTEEEEAEHGNVFIYDWSRYGNFDKYCTNLDGADERAGGRPAMAPTAVAVPESGEPMEKTSSKCSVIQGANGDGEVFPPMFIMPSSSVKTGEQIKLDPKRFNGFEQVEGKYGCSRKYLWDCEIAKNSSGGMNGALFAYWFTYILMDYYPDAEDVPCKRVLIKLDSGPGKFTLAALVYCFTSKLVLTHHSS